MKSWEKKEERPGGEELTSIRLEENKCHKIHEGRKGDGPGAYYEQGLYPLSHMQWKPREGEEFQAPSGEKLLVFVF